MLETNLSIRIKSSPPRSGGDRCNNDLGQMENLVKRESKRVFFVPAFNDGLRCKNTRLYMKIEIRYPKNGGAGVNVDGQPRFGANLIQWFTDY